MPEQAIAQRGYTIDVEVVQRLLKAADVLVFSLAAFIISNLAAVSPQAPNAGAMICFLALEIGFVCVFALRGFRLYEPRALTDAVKNAALSLAVAYCCGGLLYLAASLAILPMHGRWLAAWFAALTVHVLLTRGAAALWVRPIAAQGRFRKRIAIVGGGMAAEDAIHALETSPDLDIEIVGLFDDRADARSPEAVRRHRKIGRIAELAAYARAQRVDLIIVAIPLSAEARLLLILKRLWELPVDIRISGQASALKLSPGAYTHLGKLPLLSVFDRPLSGWGSFLKAAMDRAVAALALVVLSPLMLATALAVRLESKGPVLFKQKRYGFNNELVEIYKFRSMYFDMAEADAEKLVTKGDPRVTRVGRFIRKTSIDELPQLLNVLTGQLSLVGPRPHATQAKAAEALYEQVVDGYFARHRVKPGITGWAQIKGWRGETDTREKIEQRVKHDLEYIDRWSLPFDLYILLKTPFALLKAQNAY